MDNQILQLSLADFYNNAKKFYNEKCGGAYYCDFSDMTFEEIIRYGKYRDWISFKRGLEHNSIYLIDLVAKSSQNETRQGQLISMIMNYYQKIHSFIVTKLQTCDEPVEKIYYPQPIDIAFELKMVIEDLMKEIKQLVPDIILDEKETSHPKCAIDDVFKGKEWSRIIEGLEKENLAIKDGYFITWTETAALYGYFVDCVSIYLSIRGDNDRIPWQKFGKIVTNHVEMIVTAKEKVSKYNSLGESKPKGYKKIQGLIDSLSRQADTR